MFGRNSGNEDQPPLEILTHIENTVIGLIGTSGPGMPHTTPSEPWMEKH